MRLITQPDGSAALLLEESVRMELANDIALSASWLDDHKHHFNNLHLFQTAAALCEKLHNIAHALAANRAGEIYDQEEERSKQAESAHALDYDLQLMYLRVPIPLSLPEASEDDLECARRLAGTACCSEENGGPGWPGIETPAVAA